MAVAIYLAGAVSGCCVIWLVVASTGLGRGETGPSWRRVWLSILASTAAVATFLIIRFVAIEAPVSVYVVIRGVARLSPRLRAGVHDRRCADDGRRALGSATPQPGEAPTVRQIGCTPYKRIQLTATR